MRKTVILAIVLSMLSRAALASVPAFPGAEGYGMYSVGGRGGVVYEVTNLNDSGAGSFREACAASGPRTVVFRVSGTIEVLSRINVLNSYITIAGQTAPGDGICLRGGEMMVRAHNVIVRYMKFRGSPADSLNVMYGANNVIIDHCSISWGGDENGSFYGNTNVTIQWCMIGEGRYDHSCGGLWGSSSTYHHNLIYSNGTRNPKFAYTEGDAAADFRNNVIYNWGYQSSNAGDVGNVNMVANYYEYGPGTGAGTAKYRILGDGGANLNIYAADNYVWGYPVITADNWAGGIQAVCVRSYVPFEAPAITQQPAELARQYVVGSAGCSYPERDSTDLRFLNEMKTRTYSFAGLKNGLLYPGIPDATTTLDWAVLNSTAAPTDADHDGMPDTWEAAKGLSSANAADRNYYTLDPNYTNLEVYLNSLCPDPYAPTPNPMNFANAPFGTSTTSIAMSASAASDPCGVEYYFSNLTVADGSHDSGWQSSSSYTDTGLAPMTTYTYVVMARSTGAGLNTTIASVPASASTDVPPDHEAPEPNHMTWAVLPYATGTDAITMTASTATDRSGVQYFFTNLADPNHDSGWQDSPAYTDTGLVNNSNYVYMVKARDLSPFSNETQWSADADAMTFRYYCAESLISDLNVDCRVDLMDLAMLVMQWGQTPELLDLMVNGSFDLDISGWQFLPPVVTDGTVTASFDAADGNPAGSAKLSADTTLAAANSAKFYQIVPVTAGRNYQLFGDWMGDIKGTVPATGARNWAEIFVIFVADGSVAPTSWGTIMYKKSFGGVSQNIGPTGAWSWEPITASATDGPVDGVFTATDDYMVVAVNLGGRIGSGQTYMNIDNFQVVETQPCTAVDLNDDCILDFLDIQQFASDYLLCGRDPVTECWK